MEPTKKQLLDKAVEILSDPVRWTQEVMAADSEGNYTSYEGDSATCFCSIGAVYRAHYELTGTGLGSAFGERTLDDALNDLRRAINPKLDPVFVGIALWNDNPDRTHEEVLGTFKAAAASAGE